MDTEQFLAKLKEGGSVFVLLEEGTTFTQAHDAMKRWGQDHGVTVNVASLISVDGPGIAVWLDGFDHPLDTAFLKSS